LRLTGVNGEVGDADLFDLLKVGQSLAIEYRVEGHDTEWCGVGNQGEFSWWIDLMGVV
jgi:hypothetical protein